MTQGAIFNRVSDKNTNSDTYDITLSRFYSDLSEGQNTRLKVRGGMIGDFPLLDFKIPDEPTFGQAELNGFDLQFTLDTSKTNDVFNKYVVYKLKNNKGINNEEGSMLRIEDSTTGRYAPDAVFLCDQQDYNETPHLSYLELFSNDSDFDVITRTLKKKEPYITVEDALASISGWDRLAKFSKAERSRKMINWYEEIIWTPSGQVNGIRLVVLEDGSGFASVKDHKSSDTDLKLSGGGNGKLYFRDKKTFGQKLDGSGTENGNIRDKVKWLETKDAEGQEFTEGTNRVTPSSTFLDIVSADTNYIKPIQAVTGADSATYGFNNASDWHAENRLCHSTENYLTGNKSLHMYSMIDYDDKVTSPAVTNQIVQGFNSGKSRSSSFVCKKNIPAPTRWFDDLSGDTLPSSRMEIDIDIMFERMGCLYRAGTGVTKVVNMNGSGKANTHLRSFWITFSELLPEDGQDFGDFITSHTHDPDGTADTILGPKLVGMASTTANPDLLTINTSGTYTAGGASTSACLKAGMSIKSPQSGVKGVIPTGTTITGHGASANDATVDISSNATAEQSEIPCQINSNAVTVSKNLLGVGFTLLPAQINTQADQDPQIKITTLDLCGVAASTALGDTDDGSGQQTLTTHKKLILNDTFHGQKLELNKWYKLKFVCGPMGGDDKRVNNNEIALYRDSGDLNPTLDDSTSSTPACSMHLYILDPADVGDIPQDAQVTNTANQNQLGNPIPIVNVNYDYSTNFATNYPNGPGNWAPHLTLWNNNIKHELTTHDANLDSDILFTTDRVAGRDSINSIFVDKISIRNSSLKLSNISPINNDAYLMGKGKVTSASQSLFNLSTSGTSGTRFNTPATGIALGFYSRDVLTADQQFLLFNGFYSSNNADTNSISDSNLKAGMIDTDRPALMGTIADICVQDTTDLLETSMGASGNYIDTGDGWSANPRNDVNGFSQKGLVEISSNINFNSDHDKRECQWVSSKVLKITGQDSSQITFTVDKNIIFDIPEDINFIVYTAGSAWTEANTNHTICKVLRQDKTENSVTLMYSAGKALSSYDADDIPFMWISPELYWLVFQTDADGGVPERGYESVVLLDTSPASTSGGKGLGTTYNEFSFFASGGSTAYNNGWSIELDGSNTVLEDKDYGYHSLSETGEEAPAQRGYVEEFTVDLEGTDTVNTVELDNLMLHHSDLSASGERGLDRICLMIQPKTQTSEQELNIYSSKDSTTTKRPRLIVKYKDELPSVKDFTVKPNKENSFYPEFNWNCGDDDLWYGFISVDTVNIYNQYHNAIIHYPFNEVGAHKSAATAPTEKISGLTTGITGPLHNAEGLAGYSLEFDGGDDFVECNTGAGSDPTSACTTEMSAVVHIIPDNTSDLQYIIAQTNGPVEKFHLLKNTSNQIEARVHYGAGSNYVDLVSSSVVITDGQTPTSIILTVDTTLKYGNIKLFINGKLEDSSGMSTTTGGVNNWKIGNNIHGGNSALYIGNNNAKSDGFDGKIEEVVVYKKCLYPVSPKEDSFVFTKPLKEVSSSNNASSQSYIGKIFLKDYHNIRGSLPKEVATTSTVSWRKAGFALDES